MSLDLVDFAIDPPCVQSWRFLQEHASDGPEFAFLEECVRVTVSDYNAGRVTREFADYLAQELRDDAMTQLIQRWSRG